MTNPKNLIYYILSCAVNGWDLDNDYVQGVTLEEWQRVYEIGRNQGVTGLLFDKIKTLPKEVAPPRLLVMQWMSHTMSVEKQTRMLYQKSVEFAEVMKREGLQTMVMKGLALSDYYPNPWHREYGDLDCYLYRLCNGYIVWEGCYENGNCLAEKAGYKVKRGYYKHSHITFKGLEVENHQYALSIKDGPEVKDLERELRRQVATPERLERIAQTHLYRPSADFTALFLTAHSLSHFLFESIKLRHVLDWAFFVKAEQEHVDWDNFWQWCERMKYTRFVMCLNYICMTCLNMELPQELQRSDKEVPKLSERVMADILDGYSLYSQNHSDLKRRILIARSYLKSFWKFHQVYQRNAFWLLVRKIKNYWIKDVCLD